MRINKVYKQISSNRNRKINSFILNDLNDLDPKFY